ncbi:MAG: signal peptide peptidase SppA [Chitinophagales bacterium]|nr:signal peptide peptidase SppA [Chitinophagales bacterium]
MGSFFKYSFATVFGLFLFIFLLFLLGAGLAWFSSGKGKTKVEANSILHIKLDYPILDRTKSKLPTLTSLSFDDNSIGLNDILDNIEKAKNDDHIKGIFMEVSNLAAGGGSTEEIRNKLLSFKESGKFIVAYSEVMTQRSYYLASVADKIYLNPKGLVMLQGYSTQLTFFKDALDRLGIEPEVFYAGNFKSATEPLRYTQMSEYNRTQLRALLNDFYTNFIEKTSKARKMSAAQMEDIIDNLKVRQAEDAKANGVVDDLWYYDQVQADLKKRTGIDVADDLKLVTIEKYTDAPNPKKKSKKKDKVAILYAEGNIQDGSGDDENILSGDFVKHLQEIRNDKNVKALVLRVNSGGGSALASEIIWREIELIKQKGIPIIASMGDVAASGGYYICAGADTIVAQSNTITGSIGVFGVFAEMKDFYKSRLGMTFDSVKTSSYSDFPTSPLLSRKLTDSERTIVQKGVDDIYQDFLGRVAEGRNMPKEKVHEVAQGRVWTGTQAKQHGLVDVIGGVEEAIQIAAKKAGFNTADDYSLAAFPQEEDTYTKILKKMGASASQSKILEQQLQKELGDQYTYFKQLQQFSRMKGVQMRMPFEVVVQ